MPSAWSPWRQADVTAGRAGWARADIVDGHHRHSTRALCLSGWLGAAGCTLAPHKSHPPFRVQVSTLLLERSPPARPRPYGGLGAGPEWHTAPRPHSAFTECPPRASPPCAARVLSPAKTLHSSSFQQTARAPGASVSCGCGTTRVARGGGGHGRLLVEMGVWGGWGPRGLHSGSSLTLAKLLYVSRARPGNQEPDWGLVTGVAMAT